MESMLATAVLLRAALQNNNTGGGVAAAPGNVPVSLPPHPSHASVLFKLDDSALLKEFNVGGGGGSPLFAHAQQHLPQPPLLPNPQPVNAVEFERCGKEIERTNFEKRRCLFHLRIRFSRVRGGRGCKLELR